MALIVQKYGGTSVGNLDRIREIAEKILHAKNLGHQLVVVVSAMAGETDRLSQLAHDISALPDPRELDVLLSTGEQVTIALLSLALIQRGCEARSYTGSQVSIRTDSAHNKARIVGIESRKILKDLASGKVVVIAGFQGQDDCQNITTLGRGGSDTTAVALAAALKADECQIYTDVEGIYTADPRVVPKACKMPRVSVEEMLEMASNGAKVMQSRAVELAGRHEIPVRVLSSFEAGTGTLISNAGTSLQLKAVSSIAFNQDEAKFILHGIPEGPGIAAAVLKPLSDAHIEVDMIVQTLSGEGTIDLAFTVHQRDFKGAQEILKKVAIRLNAKSFSEDRGVAKLSLIGIGMRSQAGIASKMFEVLGEEGINIQLISTSEIKVTVIIEEAFLEKAVRALHTAFELDVEKETTIERC